MAKEKIELGISLNNNCNFHCQMCNIWRQEQGENKLDFSKCSRLIDDLGMFEVKGVRLSGGDPFLVPWSLDLAYYISSKKGYHVVATTNGSMINELFAKRITESGVNNLNLSLDAYAAETHDAIRGMPGSHQKILKAIDYLSSKSDQIRIGINTVFSNLNLDEIIPLTEMVGKDKRVDHIYFMAVMQPFGTNPDPEWFLKKEFSFLWPQDSVKVGNILDQLGCLKKKGCKINNSFAQIRTFKDYFKDPLNFTKKNKCNLGKEAVEVNQSGDVYLCYHYGSIGNIFNDSLFDIWNSEKANQIRRKIEDCRQNCNLLVNCYFEDEDV